jgi:signal transduction histidine kinase
LIIIGVSVSFTFAVLTNILLPIFTSSWNVSRFGPIFTIFLIGCIALGIVRNKMFDIRPIVARSFGYIFSLTFLGLLYGFAAFVVTDRLLFQGPQISAAQRIIYISLALMFGLSFAPAKRVFDKLSNRIFYRDAYDTQNLITNTDITKLLHESADLISAHLKPTYTKFVLLDGNHHLRFIGKQNHAITIDEAKEMLAFVGEFKESVIDVEGLHMHDHRLLRRLLQRKNAALIVKLTSHDELMGVLLVGVKRSGNTYSTKDLNVFEIVADELSLAIENSLRYEEIDAFNETLQQKVDAATRELRRTNDKLKALDEAKDEFISMASHQLRTPLTSVKGYVSMVLEGDAGKLNEQQYKLLEQAFTSSQRMVYLISDLLNVSRLRTGKFVIEPTPVYLPDVVEGEIQQLVETAAARQLELSFDKPAEFPTLSLDETKTRQVIMNFIDNAIYYTPAGGHIRVELVAGQHTIEYRVVDDGLGVPKAEQHHLFTKFYRANNARKARPDGTGLGLFMAKKVIIAQGGAIVFKSQEGKGSTFGFSFPRKKLEVSAS